jgi:pyruvate dehydrogenase E2 component (dihydrolipoamide acetyltransferase)
MPRLSLTMKRGTVGKWYKKEGESVEKSEPIVEVVSEKATYDVEAPASGILRKIAIEAGAEAAVNQVLGIITAADEPYSEPDLAETAKAVIPSVEEAGRYLASPAAKRLASEHGISLSSVMGTGPEGRIVEADVERLFQETRRTLPRIRETIELKGFRRTSAERLSQSFRTAPHSTVMMEADASRAIAVHERLNVSYSAILVGAVARVLAEFPIVNSSLERDRVIVFEGVNVGLAVATENGLVVPVIHDADKKSVHELDEAISKLTLKAKQGRLSVEEVSDGTFTITNLGMYEVDSFIPIINPPQAAILAVGAIKERPVVVNGKIEVRPVVMLSLTYDHRILDGVPAAEFLRRVRMKVEGWTIDKEADSEYP